MTPESAKESKSKLNLCFTADRREAERHIQAVTGSVETPVTFQTFVDADDGVDGYPRILHGTLADHIDELLRLNREGHGIFVMVNEGDGKGRKAENVVRLRALFTDSDGGAALLPRPGFEPSLTVQSKRGEHNYFKLKSGESLDAFTAAQKALAAHFGTDPKVKDLPRVMRLAGFYHLKDPNDAYMVRVVSVTAKEYTIAQLLAAYPAPTTLPKSTITTSKSLARNERSRSAVEQAKAFLAKQPPAIQGEGGDSRTFSICCAVARGFDLTDDEAMDVLAEWNERCSPPWQDGALREKVENARRYGTEEIGCRVKTDDIAYVVPLERYVFKDGCGSWDFDHPVGKAAAKKYLKERGFTSAERELIIDGDSILLTYGFQCVAGRPSVVAHGDRLYLNNYVAGSLVPTPGVYPRISTIMDTLTNGDRAGQAWLFNWMALKAQKPDSRNQTAVVLQGEQGTAKTTLGNILGEIIGRRNAVSISQCELESNFNAVFVTKLLVLADEVVNRDNLRDTASAIKKYVTDPKVVVNTKNVKQYEIDNRMSWWFTSNDAVPVRVEGEGDRRFTIFKCNQIPSPEYKAMLDGLYEFGKGFTAHFKEEIAAFAYDLLHHEVDLRLVGKPYRNEAREELIKTCRTSVEAFLDELVDRGIEAIMDDAGGDFGPEIRAWRCEAGVRTASLYAAYHQYCKRNGYAPQNASNFGQHLGKRFPQLVRKRQTSGDRAYYYVGLPLPSDGDDERKYRVLPS